MAIPLIIGVGLGAVGAYKGIKAAIDNNEANDMNSQARRIARRAERNLEYSRENCQASLENLGQKKIDVIKTDVQDFLEVFGKIKNVDFEHDGNLGNLALKDFSNQVIQSMRESVSFIVSSGLGAGTGLAGGALTAFGAYSGTMAFAAAGTGTAISSLSGAAATNATLAWLGGGTLASGGMGVAGGMMALGALTAGPALLIAGWYMGSKAESKLNDARSNLAEAQAFEDDMNAAIALTDGIFQVATKAKEILTELREHAGQHLDRLRNVLSTQGVDYIQYDQDAKLVVMRNVKIMQVIKAVIDTPILDEQGNLLGDVSTNLAALQQCIEHDFQGAPSDYLITDASEKSEP